MKNKIDEEAISRREAEEKKSGLRFSVIDKWNDIPYMIPFLFPFKSH